MVSGEDQGNLVILPIPLDKGLAEGHRALLSEQLPSVTKESTAKEPAAEQCSRRSPESDDIIKRYCPQVIAKKRCSQSRVHNLYICITVFATL